MRTHALSLCLIALCAGLPAQAEPGTPVPDAGLQPGAPTETVKLPVAPHRRSVQGFLLDMTRVHGVQPNTITGFGLVTGLNKKGDSSRASRRALVNAIRANNLNIDVSETSSQSYALVAVSAVIPPFSKPTQRIDAKISVAGDAETLWGGTLLQTFLRGPDGKVYAVASGDIIATGRFDGNESANTTHGSPTNAIIIAGAILNENTPKSYYLDDSGELGLRMLKPSILAVTSAVDGINARIAKLGYRARIIDEALLKITLPQGKRTEPEAVRVLRRIWNVPVARTPRALITIDQRTGTVIIGEGVQIMPCAIAIENLEVTIVTDEYVSQPGAFAPRGAETTKVSRTDLEVRSQVKDFQAFHGAGTLRDLVKYLKMLGQSPKDITHVFVKLHQAGYLLAELQY